MEIGDKVICKYNIKGTILGKVSDDMFLVRVKLKDYKVRGKKTFINEIGQTHIYSLDEIRKEIDLKRLG